MLKACIPIAIQVVIDDVGWWSGEDGSARGEPYRTGIRRNHVLDDYKAIIDLGKRLGIRPLASMVLCEWDRDNLLRKVPSCTWGGENWDNSRWQGLWLDEAVSILNNGSRYIELAIHGVGHEYWKDGVLSRAEWHDSEGKMRPKQDVIAHLDCFFEILHRNCIIGVPQSFCPPAFMHHFGLKEEGLASILKDYGIKYVITNFRYMHQSISPEDSCFGLDNGIITVNRVKELFGWRKIDAHPEGEIRGSICGIHWPALLHRVPGRNIEVIDRWVEYLSAYNIRFDRMLAPNASEAFSQLIYHRKVALIVGEKEICLDFSEINKISAEGLLDTFYLKISREKKIKSTSNNLQIISDTEEKAAGQRLLKIKYKNEDNSYLSHITFA